MALGTNIRFIADNFADASTLSVTPAVVATMPVTNLQTTARGRKMRTTNLTTQDIKGTSNTGKPIQACVLYNTTLSSNSTIRFRLYSDTAWTTLIYDSGVINVFNIQSLGSYGSNWGFTPLGNSVFAGWGNPYVAHYMPSQLVGSSFILTVTDVGNPAGYWDASRLVVGPILSPTTNIEYGFSFKWEDSSTQYRTGGGSLRTDIAPEGSFRVAKLTLDRATNQDRIAFFEFQRTIGKRKDFFVNVMPMSGGETERDFSIMAKNSEINDMVWTDYTNAGATTFTIEET